MTKRTVTHCFRTRWRPTILLGLALFILAGVAGIRLAEAKSTIAHGGSQFGSTTLSFSYPYGAQILTPADSANYDDILAQAQALGLRWVRVYLEWSRIQPTAPATPGCGNCNWTYPDKLFASLAAHNLTPIVTLEQNPAWAAAHPSGPIDQARLLDFRNFISALVSRYPDVQYWEFYNEPDDWTAADQGLPPPNDHRGWGGHAQDYAAMLKTAYDVMHPGDAATANVSRYVVFGGIAYEPKWACPTRPKKQCFDNDFVKDVLAAAPGKIFDVMNYHYYAALAPYHTPHNILGKAVELSAAFPQLKGMPFVVTEMGTPYLRSGDPTYTHERTSSEISKMFVQLLSGKDAAYKVNILAGTWFSLEHFAERSTPPQFWGLLDEKGAPWPTETSTFTILTEALAEANYEGRISGPENLEGYEFVRPDHSICVVLWSNGGIASYSFPVSSLRWLDRTRKAVNVTDGNLGDKDSRAGWVGLALDSNPIFVEYSTETATREPAAVTSTETATREPTATVTSTIPVPPSPTWPQDTPTEPQAQREQGIPTLVAAARQEPAAEFLPLRIDGTMGLVAIALAGVISSLAFLVWRSRPNR